MQAKWVNGLRQYNYSAEDQLLEICIAQRNSSVSRSVMYTDLKNLTDSQCWRKRPTILQKQTHNTGEIDPQYCRKRPTILQNAFCLCTLMSDCENRGILSRKDIRVVTYFCWVMFRRHATLQTSKTLSHEETVFIIWSCICPQLV